MEKRSSKPKPIYVIGHVNPDTDSICSAIAYAELKEKATGVPHAAMRAGSINEETKYVLKRFHEPVPSYLSSVRTEVRDVDIHEVKGIEGSESIKHAWEQMQASKTHSVPVVNKEGEIRGILSIADIAQSYLDIYDAHVLADAKTSFASIAETINGEIVCRGKAEAFTKGKVTIGASSPESMEEVIEENDMVILGNRYESQLCALELGAGCLVLCQGARPAKTILKLAKERSCFIICTRHDTFTAARLLNQAIPVEYFMTSEKLVSFRLSDKVEDIQEVMVKNRFHNFPVLDKDGKYVGFLSRRRIMNIHAKQLILVDHNEKEQAVDGVEQAEVLEIIDHHRLGGLETSYPVYFRNQPVGCTATIVAQMYEEAGIQVRPVVAGLLCSAILSDTLIFRSPTCTEKDKRTCEKLAAIAKLDIKELAVGMFQAGSHLEDKTAEEICTQDFKVFHGSGTSFGIGQVNTMTPHETSMLKKKLEGFLPELLEKKKLDMVYMMLTNIVEQSSEILCAGKNARELLVDAFGLQNEAEDLVLQGVVSRKKQLTPALVEALQAI